jgi:hypothetical protein
MKASTSDAVILVEYSLSHPMILATNFTNRFKKNPSGANRGMSTRYIGATESAIGTLYRANIVFGVISPNNSMMSVTTPVAINIPYSSGSERDFASERLARVPSADAHTFTRLLPIMTVMRSLSISDFTRSSDFAPKRLSRISHWTVCLDILRNAISVPEKNADKTIRITKINI